MKRPKTVHVTIGLPKDLLTRLDRAAGENYLSRSGAVTQAVVQWLGGRHTVSGDGRVRKGRRRANGSAEEGAS